jgi:hypothetical protein
MRHLETVVTPGGAGINGTNVVLSGKMAQTRKRMDVRRSKRVLLGSCFGNLESPQKLWDGTMRRRLLSTMNVNKGN